MGVRAGVYWPGRGDNHPGSAATPGRIGQARRSYRNKELRTKPVRRFAESRMNVAAPFYARFLLSRFAATKGMERKLRKHVPIDRSKDSGSLLDTCATDISCCSRQALLWPWASSCQVPTAAGALKPKMASILLLSLRRKRNREGLAGAPGRCWQRLHEHWSQKKSATRSRRSNCGTPAEISAAR